MSVVSSLHLGHTHTLTSVSFGHLGIVFGINPLFQIKASVSAFQRLSASLLTCFIFLKIISGSHCAQVTPLFDIQRTKVKSNRTLNTVCFINALRAQRSVNVFCWSAGMNPAVSFDRVSGNGAHPQKSELDSWPVVECSSRTC